MKKRVAYLIIGSSVSAILTAGLVAVGANRVDSQRPTLADPVDPFTIAFHDGNKPSEATDSPSNFVHTFTTGNGNNYDIRYTKAKSSGSHITLAGGGSMEKVEAASGLQSITIVASGMGFIETSYDDSYDVCYSYFVNFGELTNGTLENFEIYGNYWRYVSEDNNETTIHYLSVKYACDEALASVKPSSESVTVSGLSSFNEGGTDYFCSMQNINGTQYFAMYGVASANFNEGLLDPEDLDLFDDSKNYRIDCDFIKYRSMNVFEAYFNVSGFAAWYFGNDNPNKRNIYDYNVHLKVGDTTPDIYKGTNDVRSDIAQVKNSDKVYDANNNSFRLCNYTGFGGNFARLELRPHITVTSTKDSGVENAYLNGDHNDAKFTISFTISDDSAAFDSDQYKLLFELANDSNYSTATKVRPSVIAADGNRLYLQFDLEDFIDAGITDTDFYCHLFINGRPYDGNGYLVLKDTKGKGDWGDALAYHWVANKTNTEHLPCTGHSGYHYFLFHVYDGLVLSIHPRD